jgi:hypothetical protein
MSSCKSRGNIRPEISGTIRFNDVNFTYPERPEAPVLKDMKLKISEGECVAIVGASGSGKSTIFQWKPLTPHVLHFFPYRISSSVIGILYTNLVVDTDIFLSIVILSPLTLRFIQSPCSTVVIFLPMAFYLWKPLISSVDPTANLPIMPSHINFVVVGYRQKVYRRYQNP